MTTLTTFFKNFKKKLAVGAMGATLVLAPGGAVLAHGNHHRHDNKQYSQRHQSDPDHNKQKNAWQKSCEERQAKADQAIADYKAKAQQRYNGLSLYLSDQEALVIDNNLTIDNYDELNGKALTVQANAAQALEEIQAPTINCDNFHNRQDKKQVVRAEYQVYRSIQKFESKVKKLSDAIADQIVVS